MTKKLLILLLCSLTWNVATARIVLLPDYTIVPRDTTVFGEDDDESANDTITRTKRNLASGMDAMDYIMEKRYRSNGEVFTRKWDDHLFLQVGLGVEQMVPPGKGYSFNTLSAVNIGIGKQFNKFNSFRLSLKGAWGYQQSKDRLFTKYGLQLDHLFSLSSYFSGFRPSRLMDVSTIFGLGVHYSKLSFKNILYEEETRKRIEEFEEMGEQEEADRLRLNMPKDKSGISFEGHIGAQFRFFTGPQGYINLEPYIGLATDKMDLSENQNWRKIDVFYGVNLSYIYYIHNNLSPQERLRFVKNRREQQRLLSDSTTLQEWQQPWIFEYSNGINFLTGTQLGTGETMGHDFSISVGKWFSPVIGLRLTGSVRQMTWNKGYVPVDAEDADSKSYITNLHNIYKGVRLEAMLNPFGFFKNFSWSNKFGAYIVGGVEYGWVDKYQTERLSTRSEAYTGGIHLWYQLSDGLHFYVEPRFMHYVYKIPYTNVDWNKLYSDNSFSVSFGIQVATRSARFRDVIDEGNGDGRPHKLVVGVGGGFNLIHTKTSYADGNSLSYNGKGFIEYHPHKIHGLRASFDFVSMPRSGVENYYDYNMDEEVTPDPSKTQVLRRGLWKHNYRLGLASLGNMINLSNALCGFNPNRSVDFSAFLGPTAVIPMGDKAEPSPDEPILANHKVELEEPFQNGGIKFGAHLGVKVQIKASKRLGLFVEPTLYLLNGINMPCVDFLSVKYMQTLNVGIQYGF